jgi:hypothetical protein
LDNIHRFLCQTTGKPFRLIEALGGRFAKFVEFSLEIHRNLHFLQRVLNGFFAERIRDRAQCSRASGFPGPHCCEHRSAIALLRWRLADPGFASGVSPVERAEMELLDTAPLDFVSCTARRGRHSSTPRSVSAADFRAVAGGAALYRPPTQVWNS